MRRSVGGISCVVMLAAWVSVSCSSEDTTDEKTNDALDGWHPGVVLATEAGAGVRGLLDLRGVIHSHSVYSHDACDGKPRDASGAMNAPCFEDVRYGICKTQHDFVMLSDHADLFAETEYPDVLLYRQDLGDKLIERGGGPVANWAGCATGGPTLVMAGTETGSMPVGLEHHLGDTPEERQAAYGAVTPEAIEAFKAAGAVSLMQHTEDWTVEELTDLPIDGFEMYNLHANMYSAAGEIMGLLAKLNSAPEKLPHPDLAFVPLVGEDSIYLSKWGSVLARGARRVTTMATDSHQNTAWQILPDGERIDSFRRLMQVFSNHLLVKPAADGTWDDTAVKQALRTGRLYGVFEHLGYAAGFDYYATDASGTTREMGEETSIAASAELHVRLPHVRDLSARAKQPQLRIRILRAVEGGWEEAASSESDLDWVAASPGAYRAEVRMTPHHLAPYLSAYANRAEKETVWIYSNAVYVVE